MTARPDTWMPMYWGDYARDTGHLNAAGHGAYLMLIKHYWCSGSPLPDDDNELWRIACCDSLKEWRALRAKIVRMFALDNGLLRHGRIDRELAKAASVTIARSEAGRKGAESKWQTDGKRIANASVSHRQNDGHVQPPLHPQPEEESKILLSGRTPALSDAETADEALAKAAVATAAEGEILRVARQFRTKPGPSAATLERRAEAAKEGAAAYLVAARKPNGSARAGPVEPARTPEEQIAALRGEPG